MGFLARGMMNMLEVLLKPFQHHNGTTDAPDALN